MTSPDDLPAEVDAAAVRRMETVAWLLDDSVRVPGTDFKVGLDPLLGLLPGSGDALGAACSLYIVAEATRLGVSIPTLVRMLANVAVDAGVGSVPVLGDAFDAVWKANKRNVELALDELTGDRPAADEDAVTIPIEE